MFRHRTHQQLVTMLCAVLANAILLVGTSFSAAEVDEQAAAQSKAVTATPSRQLTTPTVPNNSAAEERSSPANQRASNAEALKLRPGEQTGEGTRGRALVLGMALQEAKNGHPRIVDVTTASPAWDAGIKKGDEIVSFQGLQADTYRKWIDGMQRLATGLPVGAPILVIVSRDGKQIPYRVLSPGPAVRAPRPNPLVQQGNPVVPPPSGTAGAAPPGPLVAPALEGNDIAIANAGPFGAFFAGATEGATDRAIAHIVRLNASPSTNAAGVTTGTSASEPNSPQSPSNGATSVPPKGRVRIGLAGFHDDPSGMVVMVDVGALPAGTYSVRISDPSVMGGLNEVGTAPAASTQQPQPEVANTATSPTGGVTEATPTANQGPPASAPPNGPGQPVPAPAANNTVPNASRLGQTPNSGAQTTQVPAQNGTSGRQMNTAAGSSGGATAATNDIGTITINQNGVGRMQQTVQGMKVQNVVGQAIVIYGPTGIFRAHVPDSKGDVSSPSGEGGITRSSARSSQGNINGSQGAKNSQAAASGTTATGSGGPVAAGIIRLISDRRPPANGEGAARTPNVNNPAIEQPASAAPAAGQNGVR